MNDRPYADAALRRLDELIAEAAELRAEIAAALVRQRRPFFPDRRHAYQPHAVERRQSR